MTREHLYHTSEPLKHKYIKVYMIYKYTHISEYKLCKYEGYVNDDDNDELQLPGLPFCTFVVLLISSRVGAYTTLLSSPKSILSVRIKTMSGSIKAMIVPLLMGGSACSSQCCIPVIMHVKRILS